MNVTPSAPPPFVGGYDFDLLGQGIGKACADRDDYSVVFWVGIESDAKLTKDGLTQQAIAAATLDAISKLGNVDTMLLTRVVAEGKGTDRVCATVVGRGVRIKKAATVQEAVPQADATTALAPADSVAAPQAFGTLRIQSTPPCEISVGQNDLGLRTPQDVKLTVGRHRITLSNPKLGIKDTFVVDISQDATETVTKDYAEQLTRPDSLVDPFKK